MMLPSPLHLSTLSFKMVGYMVEQNLRIARVLTKVALDNNPFFSASSPVPRARQKPSHPMAKATPKPAEKQAPRAQTPTATAAARPEPVAKLVSDTSATAKAAPAKPTAKRPRQPSAPPQMPAKPVRAEPKAKV
jgi:hypothetical protein